MSQPDRAALVAKVTEMVQRWDDIAAFDAEEGNIQSGEAYEQCADELRDVLSLLTAEPAPTADRPDTLRGSLPADEADETFEHALRELRETPAPGAPDLPALIERLQHLLDRTNDPLQRECIDALTALREQPTQDWWEKRSKWYQGEIAALRAELEKAMPKDYEVFQPVDPQSPLAQTMRDIALLEQHAKSHQRDYASLAAKLDATDRENVELRAALTALSASHEALKQERDTALNAHGKASGFWGRATAREIEKRKAAEAHVAALTAILQQIAAHSGDRFALDSEGFPTIRQDSPQAIAAAALASIRQEREKWG